LANLDESLLTGLPPFSRLARPQIRAILDQATPKLYPEGAAVFSEGEAAGRFFLLLDGYIRVVRTTPGGEQVIALHIPPGQLFGIAPAIGRDTYPATAICAAEVLALSWPVRLWPEFTSKYDGFATESYKTVGARLGEFQARVTDLATKAVEQRVAACLPRMGNPAGPKGEGRTEHGFPVRMVIPGLYGFISATKWLTKITLTTYKEQEAYWTERDWATDAPIKHSARIDTPKALSEVDAGTVVIDSPATSGTLIIAFPGEPTGWEWQF